MPLDKEARRRYLAGETSKPSAKDPRSMTKEELKEESELINQRRSEEYRILPKFHPGTESTPGTRFPEAASSRLRAIEKQLRKLKEANA